ncbi:MAG: DUF1015 family protein, partial [Candidatus Choladocola sp.]|nr:DUF1015 family protein [Candidatus Choladocola sp.]
MAEMRPFQCVRPAKEYVSRVAALPYDVYNRKEAYQAAARDRLSFLNIDRPETQFGEEQDMYAPEVYKKAHDMLYQEMEDGVFLQDKKDCFYLYELTMDGRAQTGLVACASIDDYLNHVIKKHENTRAEKEEDRIRHVDVCSAQTGPIFLAYRKNIRIEEIIRKVKQEAVIFDFASEDGIRHRGWQIADEKDIQNIQNIFSGINEIYIADGHHRAASAVLVGLKRRMEHPDYNGTEEFNYFLSILFQDEELLIMDYNRVVKDLNGWTKTEFLKRAEEKFLIRKCKKGRPQKKGQIMMLLGDSWYQMTVREEFTSDDPVEGLDVSILQRELLDPILGIKDPKKDKRIDFIGGIRGLEELEKRVREDCAVAFAMYPTSIQELFQVADAGRLMPPKSTWFEPKLRSGL